VEIIVNDQPQQVPQATTVAQLLDLLGLNGRLVAVEVNLELVSKARHDQHRLSPGDRLEIVTLVGGG
jgi:thiamine biosynthesis protein ThiS